MRKGTTLFFPERLLWVGSGHSEPAKIASPAKNFKLGQSRPEWCAKLTGIRTKVASRQHQQDFQGQFELKDSRRLHL